MYDYFYGAQSDEFSFIRIPTVLFSEDRFKALSAEAKVLYGILLKRMDLSARNGWFDKQGRVYIICTLEEIMETLNCADKKATRLMNELETKCGLIERKRQGLGRPNLIYVKNFITRQNNDSRIVKTTIQEPSEQRTSNTDISDTDLSDTENPILSGPEADGMAEHHFFEHYFREHLEMDLLLQDLPEDQDTLHGILSLLTDTCCSRRKYIRIAADDKPREVVKSRLMKLNSFHIRYVLKCLKENAADVRNIKQYLLAALYNAPTTMDAYYQARVNHDIQRKEVTHAW